MRLRKYQEDSINNTRDLFYKGNKRVLTVLPCGAGKTVEFAYMCNLHVAKNKNNYCWFLVHRKELIDQAIETFIRNNISMNNVLIAMVQTVTRHIDDYRKPTMIIFDEAHHSTSKTWTRIIDAFPNVPIVGLTATPCRLDGKPLGDIYQAMTIGISAKELIELGYLCHYDYYAPKIDLEDANWEVKGSDYDMQSVEESFDKASIYGDVLKYINQNRKTIIYAPTIKFSKQLIANIPGAVHFDGDTPKQEREDIINKFRSGEIRVLSNVNLIGEGFDCPDCDCVILLRPTMSTALYIQQSMRCLRPAPGKRAVIYDLVGNVFRHGLPDDDREWSLSKHVKPHKNTDSLSIRECKNCFRVYPGNQRVCPYCGFDNGKTKKEIEIEQQAELERITELKKKQERMEVGRCKDFQSLVALAKRRGYKNPVYWANTILMARNKKIKKI